MSVDVWPNLNQDYTSITVCQMTYGPNLNQYYTSIAVCHDV